MVATSYPACVAFTRKQEGGNSDVRGDRGGRTGRGGITHITYDAYRNRKGLPLRDVFRISDGEIADIYRDEYWAPIDGDNLPVGVDLCLFDIAINSGPLRAKHIWKQTQYTAGMAAQVHAICANRRAFLQSLRTWSQFGRGWSRRVADCEATAIRMVAAIDPATKLSIDKTNASKAVTKSRTQIGAGVVVSGGVAATHSLAQMPFGMVMAILVITAFIVIHGIVAAKVAVEKLPPAVKAPVAHPPGLSVAHDHETAAAQWPPMVGTGAAVAPLRLSSFDIDAVADAVITHLEMMGTFTHNATTEITVP